MNERLNINDHEFTNSDSPIDHIDADRFGLDGYVKALSQIIMSNKGPFTISVQGDWGAGKTSFVNMIKDYLTFEKKFEGNNKYVDYDIKFIEFNTWEYSILMMTHFLFLLSIM